MTVAEHLEKALECLMDEFHAWRAGPSGLRAQAIAHVRYALLLLGRPESRLRPTLPKPTLPKPSEGMKTGKCA